ncbi:hypothetical protein RhiJN_01184 [Ceratobasidium sp. AG-Ba]|nr:hypothetical protein RhiJN_01184 [Ceratobasidium sp. AG-Ba]QRW02213.1 hypothetical protein RhiLY_01210 [Ceratobasidium sp. AG-Ba]
MKHTFARRVRADRVELALPGYPPRPRLSDLSLSSGPHVEIPDQIFKDSDGHYSTEDPDKHSTQDPDDHSDKADIGGQQVETLFASMTRETVGRQNGVEHSYGPHVEKGLVLWSRMQSGDEMDCQSWEEWKTAHQRRQELSTSVEEFSVQEKLCIGQEWRTAFPMRAKGTDIDPEQLLPENRRVYSFVFCQIDIMNTITNGLSSANILARADTVFCVATGFTVQIFTYDTLIKGFYGETDGGLEFKSFAGIKQHYGASLKVQEILSSAGYQIVSCVELNSF